MSEEFRKRWLDGNSGCGYPIAFVKVNDDTLPTEAAPGLTFRPSAQARPIWETWNLDPGWVSKERDRLSRYLEFGSDGAGNPICLERDRGSVWLLDHEDDFSAQFVNTSVTQLAESLLAYLGERNADVFRAAIQGIDSAAMADDAFWAFEANVIGAE
ncbi:MAG: SUKH-4 family immunity protein [Woeseiaceae bacterium]|nr:SUKH-4 family immunity protein [Woeseiaceae bacterium]